MSGATATADDFSGTRARNAWSLLLFMLSAAALLLRFAISPQLLDKVIDYTSEGGPFYEKLHVGTYAILLVALLALFGQSFVLRGDDIGKFRALVRYCLLIGALMIYLGVLGHFSSGGFLIDTYIAAAVAGLVMLAQSPSARRMLGNVTLGMLILSAVIGIGEAVTKHRLLPYDFVEEQFRPIGLSEHPLALGALCATAIGFTACTSWRIWVRVAAIFVLLIGCVASGARFALICAAVEIVLLLMLTPWPKLTRRHARQAKAIVLALALLGGAALVALFVADGLLDRFGGTLSDGNAMVRVSIYQIFGLVSWRDLMFGMRADDLVAIVTQQLHLPTIESAPVVVIMLFGLPAALFFVGITGWVLVKLMGRASTACWIGTITFLAASLSNNALSGKTPVFAIAVVLILAFAGRRSDAGAAGAAPS